MYERPRLLKYHLLDGVVLVDARNDRPSKAFEGAFGFGAILAGGFGEGSIRNLAACEWEDAHDGVVLDRMRLFQMFAPLLENERPPDE
jgi:hypothetical protein